MHYSTEYLSHGPYKTIKGHYLYYAGQPVATTTMGIIIDPGIAENQAPESPQNAAVNFVSGVPGPQLQSCTKLFIPLFVLSFVIVFY